MIKTLPDGVGETALRSVLVFMSLEPLAMKFAQQQPSIDTKLQLSDSDRDKANNRVVVRNVTVERFE